MMLKIPGNGVSMPGKTKLDKEKTTQCQTELVGFLVVFSLIMYFSSVQESIALQARQWKLQITGQNVREKYKGGLSLLERVKSLIHDVRRVGWTLQLTDILPDVFIWMISGNKRVAYHRITSRCQQILNYHFKILYFCQKSSLLFLVRRMRSWLWKSTNHSAESKCVLVDDKDINRHSTSCQAEAGMGRQAGKL